MIFVPETREAAKARQIQTLYDKVEIEKLQDLKSEELCEINFNDEEISSDETAEASFNFDESLIGKKVKLSCDQFERFGISEDKLLTTTITGASEMSENIECDYGSVTTPTVYFWFVSSNDLKTDYCAAALTVIPLEENKGECFSDEIINEMKEVCEEKSLSYYSISDANGCETIYCGWGESQNLCPSESLLKKSEETCEADGGTPVRYSEEIAGQDFPCSQIRCSQCPAEEETLNEMQTCEEKGGIPLQELDHETGCNYVYCESPETENQTGEENKYTETQENQQETEENAEPPV